MAKWTVEVEDSGCLKDLWGALNDPNPDTDPKLSYVIKRLVGKFEGFSVHIYADEHPPPHFRISYGGKTADYTIKDCEQIAGDLRRHYRKVRAWHARNKTVLVESWNERRPTDCPVGPIVGDAR